MTRAGLGVLLAVTLIAVSACGGNSDSGDKAPSQSASKLGPLKAELEQAFKGTYEAPPSTGPKAQRGKNVWWMSIGQAGSVPAAGARGGVEAGKLLGWDVTVFDGQYDTNRIQGGIRQALAAGADGIVMYAVDCAPVQAALESAKRAKVPVIGIESADCEKPLFTHRVGYVEGTFEDWTFALGRALGIWTVVKSSGKAKTISLSEKGLVATERYQEGYVDGHEDCADCELTVLEYTAADLGPRLQAKVQQAILQNPKADFIEASYDGPIMLSVVPAMRATGSADRFSLVGGEGSPPFMKLVREDKKEHSGYGTAIEWEGYAGMDSLNRILAGEKPVDNSGVGVQIYDRTHNTPPTGPYAAPFDFRAAYGAVWSGTQ
ncbi:MAG: ribose transport system substrate-binding protein [Thermoleophilaceae bacterium]|jgi:ribose transport system substrate-binding protein|nr:ribose transport system substrate-binding protein [Thermoleophilaceae bacterium]MEA2401152.1 ribose transport system substrate-binding protein [Thermoleophilaceae bacterium]